eukprot:TRINITY_DN7053_c0_g1_i2.p1 TRINITY_DN7053_c0_g1~~TRINITY_DN7053_c0_g1_i2.p1  ORF type:complete len:255 (+),score=49.38 TRINITY_DN7053_c0_g1_i2:57-821(+)
MVVLNPHTPCLLDDLVTCISHILPATTTAAMNGSRLTVYDYLKEKHNEYTGRGLTLPENIAAAAFAGSIGAFFGSPFYLVKTQQQAQTAVEGIGYQHKHTSSLQAFRNIVATEGVFGLWRGVFGSIPRLMVGSAAQLTSYSKSKETIQSLFPHLQEGIAQQFAASMLAGSFVAVCMNPFDVITTRLYNQPVDPVTKRGVYYSGFLDAFVKIARTEGVTGFYKGLSALYFRIGPHTVLTFVFWERLRALVGAKYV